MSNLTFKSFILFLSVFSQVVFAASPVYTVMTEEFSPFGYYQKDGRLTGIAVELTRLLLVEMQHPDNIRVLPWARAFKNIEKKPNHILFAMARTAEREHKFQWVGPILSDNIYLFQRSDDETPYISLAQALAAEYVAVSRDFPEQEFLEKMGFLNLILTTNPDNTVKLLMRKRVSLIAAGATVINSMLEHAGYNPQNIKRTGIKLFGTDLYIAFSTNISKTEIQRWQTALDLLKEKPEYQKLISDYNFN